MPPQGYRPPQHGSVHDHRSAHAPAAARGNAHPDPRAAAPMAPHAPHRHPYPAFTGSPNGRDGGRDGGRQGGRDGARDGGRQGGRQGGPQGDRRGPDPRQFQGQPQGQQQGWHQTGHGGGQQRGQSYGAQGQRGGGGGGSGNQPRHGGQAASTYVDIDGVPLIKPAKFIPFENLTTIDPQPRLDLEHSGCAPSCRLIDMFCPIGRGQRGMIVSPPKAGKTTLLKDIATALLRNHADLEVVVLLIDERPEEVTDFRRTFANVDQASLDAEMLARGSEQLAAQDGSGRGDAAGLARGSMREIVDPDTGEITLVPADNAQDDAQDGARDTDAASLPAAAPRRSRVRVVASSNDHTVERHIQLALSTIEACKRMVECGKHVVILLDSLTRLGRAFNNSRRHASSGRTMTGGLDSKALEVPRQIFGAARNTEEAGSLTIIASCLVDTGSAADQIIFEEFKGSGNMELILDRKIAERRVFPAINLAESGTRKEDKMMPEGELKTVTALRRRLLAMPGHQQMEQLLAALKRFPTNAALVGSNTG
jgi:transcription termination factor Rho